MSQSSLLDFITTLVHDPDAAAAYRADPQSALSAANLHDVTTADVDHLIPVVAESASGSIWSASNAAHSFDTSIDSAFDTPAVSQDTAVGFDHSAAEPSSMFDAATVPDAGAAEHTSTAFDDVRSIDFPDDAGTPIDAAGFTDLQHVPVDPVWPDSSSEASATDGFGVDGHDHSTIPDHTTMPDHTTNPDHSGFDTA